MAGALTIGYRRNAREKIFLEGIWLARWMVTPYPFGARSTFA